MTGFCAVAALKTMGAGNQQCIGCCDIKVAQNKKNDLKHNEMKFILFFFCKYRLQYASLLSMKTII
jgi:hypothetical protein